jgi:hypothetical protein
MLKVDIGCKPTTPKCKYTEWNVGAGVGLEMKPCCIKHLRELIWYLAELFDEQEITYWMDFGTLLGAIRGGRSIPHDTDGDFCLYARDRDRVVELQKRMARDGFCMGPTKKVPWRDGHIKIYRSKINLMCVDLFFWKHDLETDIMKSGGLNTPKSFPHWWVERLYPVTIFDKPIMAPREPEKFLRMRFGKDWRTPQNKKVHFEDAEETHKYGFEYATKQGWKKPKQKIIYLSKKIMLSP